MAPGRCGRSTSLGLLDGRRATTHWRAAAELAARYPHVQVDADVLYVDDGLVATSAGIDLCLHLVRNDHRADAAARVARRMVVAPHRDGGQAQYLQRIAPPSGTGLAGTCAWALERLDDPLTVKDLARHSGWAPRTTLEYLCADENCILAKADLRPVLPRRDQHHPVALAHSQGRRLLEVSDLSVEQIAAGCGLGSAANLRLYLARDTSTTPTAYRRTYQGSNPRTRDSHDGT